MNTHYYSGSVVQKCERFEFNSEGKPTTLWQFACDIVHNGDNLYFATQEISLDTFLPPKEEVDEYLAKASSLAEEDKNEAYCERMPGQSCMYESISRSIQTFILLIHVAPSFFCSYVHVGHFVGPGSVWTLVS